MKPMAHPASGTTAAEPARMTVRTTFALSLGTFVEWFDFALYGFSTAVIAAQFFPSGNPTAALLGTLAIYGVSFVARPIGGVVMGRVGDRHGRRTALAVSLVLMGLSTALIGVIPPYAVIGFAAPLLLTLCRLVQGFAAASELTGAATYAAESAPPGRRGLYVNVVSCFGSVGTAVATLVVLLFRLDTGFYESGGWRWPFIAGGVIACGGIYLRLRLAETGVHLRTREKAPWTLRQTLRRHGRTIGVLIVFYALVGVGFHTLLGYMPTYMTKVAGISATAALWISLFAFVTFAVSCVAFGALTDRVGRKPVMITAAVAIPVLTVPAYLLIAGGNLPLMCVAQALLVVPVAAVQAAGNVTNAEIFPPEVRYSAGAIAYTFSYAVFAGTAPLLDAVLLDVGGKLLPAFYGVLIAVIALPFLVKGIPESRGFSIETGDRRKDS
ncbi:MFS transporter [Amycolatopsis rhabdoformis]|uniref:MFS transporter n=1 Tax=Amycolatopsis rhabdoformis TaxID=1448059 RepID=A0ABZ1II79_9PSEU|nr:MFS transporter [Amycolatopsis rhabdoformis]WSE34154.1 MFS transporter [Amycolatopsis rhabdoformis]